MTGFRVFLSHAELDQTCLSCATPLSDARGILSLVEEEEEGGEGVNLQNVTTAPVHQLNCLRLGFLFVLHSGIFHHILITHALTS